MVTSVVSLWLVESAGWSHVLHLDHLGTVSGASCLGVVMTTFGLVHGAFHGSWCWERLTPELERLGHRVLTVDLPSEEPLAGAAEYAAVAVTAFADAGEDLVRTSADSRQAIKEKWRVTWADARMA